MARHSAQGVVEVIVPDPAKSVHFYEILGFALERRAKGFVSHRRGGVRLYLAESPEAPTTERWVNLRISAENVDDVWALAQRARLEVDVLLGDRPSGLRDLRLLDPAGFQVRFAQVITPGN
jgi:catechol 2,3-dioxygenase-like lactoylglutathione lyase family enzyme